MFTQTRKLFLGCVLLALAGCSGSGSDSDSVSPDPEVPGLPTPVLPSPEPLAEAEKAAALSTADLVLEVTDPSGNLLSGVSVLDDSGELGVTDDSGRLTLVDTPTGEKTLRFALAGYAPQVWAADFQTAQTQRVVLIAREASVSFVAAEGADITGKDGAAMVAGANAFVTAAGDIYSGNVLVSVTPVDVASGATAAGAFPGSFNAVLEDGSERPLITYGTVEYHFTDESGNELQLAEGQTATIEVPVYVTSHPDGTPVRLGDVIPFWYLDEDTGIWHEDGEGTVVASEHSPTGLAQRGEVSHFTWWNVDISPRPAEVRIESVLPEAEDVIYRIEYIVTPLNSRYSQRREVVDYRAGGLAVFDGYIPDNTQAQIDVVLYQYLNAARSSTARVARDGGRYFFAAGEERVLRFDFSDTPVIEELSDLSVSGELLNEVNQPLEMGGDLVLIPGTSTDFRLAELDGLMLSATDASYLLHLTEGPQWFADMLTITADGKVFVRGEIPEFDATDIVIDIWGGEDDIVYSIVLRLIPGSPLEMVVSLSDIVIATAQSVGISGPEVSGGFAPYNVSLLPVSASDESRISATGSLADGFTITGVREGIAGARFSVSDASGRNLFSDTFEVTVVAAAPVLSNVENIRLLIGRNITLVPEVEGLVATWSYDGVLPPGVTFDASSGEFSGTLDRVGTFPLTLTAANLQGSHSTSFTIAVNPETLAPMTDTGLNLSQLTGINAASWTLVSGSLPQGLHLDADSGVISGAAQESGEFLLTFDADGSPATFTLTVSEILNNPPELSADLPDTVRLGGRAVFTVSASDIDGDEISVQVQVSDNSIANLVSLSADTYQIDVSAVAMDDDEFEITIIALDSAGSETVIRQTVKVERQAFALGPLLSNSPSINSPAIQDTGDSCVMYYQSSSSYGAGLYYVYDKETASWTAELGTAVNNISLLDIETQHGVTVWGGYIPQQQGLYADSYISAGFMVEGELVPFTSLPDVSEENLTARINHVLAYQTAGGGLRLYVSVTDEGLFYSDDQGESWNRQVIEGVSRLNVRNLMDAGGVLMVRGYQQAEGYFNEILLVSDDEGLSWEATQINNGIADISKVISHPETGLRIGVGNYYYNDGMTVAEPGINYSYDGLEWQRIESFEVSEGGTDFNRVQITSLEYSNGRWLAAGYGGSRSVVAQSYNGIDWNLLYTSTDSDALIKVATNCFADERLLTVTGNSLIWNNLAESYQPLNEDLLIQDWYINPLEADIRAYEEKVDTSSGRPVYGGAFVHETADGIDWQVSEMTLDGVAMESLPDFIVRGSDGTWYLPQDGLVNFQSDNGVDFESVPYSLPEDEVLENLILTNEGFELYYLPEDDYQNYYLVTTDGILVNFFLQDSEWTMTPLADIKDSLPDFAPEDLRRVSVATDGVFYLLVDSETESGLVTELLQYTPGTGLTLEEGCWFNGECYLNTDPDNELGQIGYFIQPVGADHFIMYSLADVSSFWSATQYRKGTGGEWQPQDISFLRSQGLIATSEISVEAATPVSPALVTMPTLGVMAYDAEAATLAGPLTIGQQYVGKIRRSGDQYIAVTSGYRPQAYVLPIDFLSGMEWPAEYVPEVVGDETPEESEPEPLDNSQLQ